ncbi:hypothetical protein RFI_09018 [Reticulomyxa filosa]|uniref:Uncharacterized protein n=1 Tax=Reticulomyxa filosa TaxID=46433 RepID=X6NQW9_RETFI|nr:hypothetical protein RFI_09018 [Reticulomyxa filosa]|eukprot:ETO28114.1 hypothetical protein RFI_09018 [Reticulomyxa filosa]
MYPLKKKKKNKHCTKPIQSMLYDVFRKLEKPIPMNEIQDRLFDKFGIYLPTTMLSDTLKLYGASLADKKLNLFRPITVGMPPIDTSLEVLVNHLDKFLAEQNKSIAKRIVHNSNEMQSLILPEMESVALDKISAIFEGQHGIIMKDNPKLWFDLLEYLIDKRSMDYICTMDAPTDMTELKWSIRWRPPILFNDNTTALITVDDIFSLISQHAVGAILCSDLQSMLLKHYDRVIVPTRACQYSLLDTLTKMIKKSDSDWKIQKCGPDAILYHHNKYLYQKAIQCLLIYQPTGLTISKILEYLTQLLGIPQQTIREHIPNLYDFILNYCLGFVKFDHSMETNTTRIFPFHKSNTIMFVVQIQSIEPFHIRTVVDELVKENTFFNGKVKSSDGIPFLQLKAELEKRRLWNAKMHKFILTSPFLNVCRRGETLWVSLQSIETVNKNLLSILRDIATLNLTRCTLENLPIIFAETTGTQLIINRKNFSEFVLKDVGLQLRYNNQTNESMVIPRMCVVRWKKSQSFQIPEKLIESYDKEDFVQCADFGDEYVIAFTSKLLDEKPTQTNPFTTLLDKKQLKIVKTNLQKDNDGTIASENISTSFGLDAANLSNLIHLKGPICNLLKSQKNNTIFLSQIQDLYRQFYSKSWWSCNIYEELKILKCEIVPDGIGDYIVDIKHLKSLKNSGNV